jgi:uncharacterized protein YabN with tetrapyrrole methylase and pyrophosphatase domain
MEIPMSELDIFMRAWQVQLDAAALGFDWPDIHGPLAKVREETKEIEDALAENNLVEAQKELGDLLFATINAARFLDVTPAEALSGTVSRFEKRFAYVKEEVARLNKKMKQCTLEELDRYWEEAKNVE